MCLAAIKILFFFFLCFHLDCLTTFGSMMYTSVVWGSPLLQDPALHLPDGANHRASMMRSNQRCIYN